MYWLSYGGGVNSTALAVLMVRNQLPQYDPWRIIFADTGCEKPQTYEYIGDHFSPWLIKHGKILEIVKPQESVLERWERYSVTGSRRIRACTYHGKVLPIQNYIIQNGVGGVEIIGIHAGEEHRQPNKIRPLVNAGIDQAGCVEIIKAEGLPVPVKSGCWCCPFARVSEVIELSRRYPCMFARIERLEQSATEKHGLDKYGRVRTHWADRPASYWRERAKQQVLFDDYPDIELPCGCYDGE